MSEETRTSLQSRLRARLSNTLASTGTFFVPENPDIKPTSHFGDVLADPSVSKEIDPVALCEFPGHYSFFGSRTILRQVHRTDLYADNRLELLEMPIGVPGHGQRKMPAESVAEGFVELLLDETRERVQGCRHLGLLLSGGMDSRIVAAALAKLQRSGSEFSVTCFTWGQPGTRDVVYAGRIARHYNWDFEHFKIDSEILWENVLETARTGCFHSAMHLHAMSAVAKCAAELGVELMLAGSYGDSIGRAEYSGSHVSSLAPIETRIRNWYGLFDEALFENCKTQTLEEIDRCHRLYGNECGLAVVELDYQLHYMRNMLGSAMSVIDARVPLAQAFTSRSIVEFIWSLAPASRTDKIYMFVLRQLDSALLQIPWARTGKPFLEPGAATDVLQRRFHEYAKWTRDNVRRLEKSIFSGSIERSGAFNMKAVHDIFRTFQKYQFVQSGRLVEIVLWLGSLGLLLAELDAPPVGVGDKKGRVRLQHRLQLYGTVARQYQSFGRKTR